MKTMKIPLTRGYEAIVDYEDWLYLKDFKWRASSINKTNKTIYAIREIGSKKLGNRTTESKHRVVMKVNKGQQVDHIDGNGLNNTKENLRIATSSQNCSNVKKYFFRNGKKVTSKYKGVNFHKRMKKWQASIRYNKKLIHLGTFDDEIEAAKAYDKKAKELFKEFAILNFPNKNGV